MFQTLKARRTNTGESAYVVQSSGLPFEKDKGKKPRACTLCKLKKLKCVIEGNSCVKCMKQGIECSYRSMATKNTPSAPSSSRGPSSSKTERRALPHTSTKDGTPKSSASSSPSNPLDRRTADSTPDSTPALSVQGETAETSTTASNASLSIHDEPLFSEAFPFSDLLGGSINFDFWSLSNDGMEVGATPIYLATNDTTDCHPDVTSFPPIHTSGSSHRILPSSPRGSSNSSKDDRPIIPITSRQHSPDISIESISWKHDPIREPRLSPLAQFSNISSPHAASLAEHSETERCEIIPPHPPPASCRCLEQLMSANEAMQVKLVWGTSAQAGSAVSVDDMLQCQKDMLASCGTLLECNICSLRSDYVMLVVSMCREMMNGIMDLSAMIIPNSQHGSRKRAFSEANDGTLASFQRVNAGGWRLDDQDEMAVIKSLIGIRITRLRSLIARLEKAVNTHHSDYEWIVNALRQIVTEKVASIELEINEI
ncbi:hypothetical protein F5Y19DRAFT_493385 [Xylariaceae sp. FL1651]|nr:hypothetical protein F5Y19DRAFT_493385 [Xylariaceae sp. FL1651]